MMFSPLVLDSDALNIPGYIPRYHHHDENSVELVKFGSAVFLQFLTIFQDIFAFGRSAVNALFRFD